MSQETLINIIKQKEFADNKESFGQYLIEKNLVVTSREVNPLAGAKMLSTKDVCSILQVERHHVYKLVESGRLPSFKKKTWKFRLEDVKKYIETMLIDKSSSSDVERS